MTQRAVAWLNRAGRGEPTAPTPVAASGWTWHGAHGDEAGDPPPVDPAVVVAGAVSFVTAVLVVTAEGLDRLGLLTFARAVALTAIVTVAVLVVAARRGSIFWPDDAEAADDLRLALGRTVLVAAVTVGAVLASHGTALRPVALAADVDLHVRTVDAVAQAQRVGGDALAGLGEMDGYPNGSHLVAAVVSWATGLAPDRAAVAVSAVFLTLVVLLVGAIARLVTHAVLARVWGVRTMPLLAESTALAATALFLCAPHYGIAQLTTEFRMAQLAALALVLTVVAACTSGVVQGRPPHAAAVAVVAVAVSLCHPAFVLFAPIAYVVSIVAMRGRVARADGPAVLAVTLAAAVGRILAGLDGSLGSLLTAGATAPGTALQRVGGALPVAIVVGGLVWTARVVRASASRHPAAVPAAVAVLAVAQLAVFAVLHVGPVVGGVDVSWTAATRTLYVLVPLTAALTGPALAAAALRRGWGSSDEPRPAREATGGVALAAAAVILAGSLGSGYARPHAQVVRVRNPSFESGLVGWNEGSPDTEARTTDASAFAPDGRRVATLRGTAGTLLSVQQDIVGAARLGQRYDVQVWARSARPEPGRVTVALWELCPTSSRNASAGRTVSSWTPVLVSLVPAHDRCRLRVELYADSPTQEGDVAVQLDDVQFAVHDVRDGPPLANPGFEHGSAGWEVGPVQGTSLAVRTTAGSARTGSVGGRLTVQARRGSVAFTDMGSGHPGRRYQARVWLRADDPAGTDVALVFWSRCADRSRQRSTRAHVAGDWTPVSVVLPVRQACPLAVEVFVLDDASPEQPVVVDLDDLEVTSLAQRRDAVPVG